MRRMRPAHAHAHTHAHAHAHTHAHAVVNGWMRRVVQVNAIGEIPERLKSERDPDAAWRALLIGIIGCAFLLRVLYAFGVELLPEEAYY